MGKMCKTILAIASVGLLALVGVALAQSSGDPLAQGFQNPPDSAKPRTWWHWTGGNVTKEGITKDFEWMKRVGIAGYQLADVSSGSGQTVEKKLIFGTPEWLNAIRHSATEGKRLGLEMSIFSSPGWSEAGRPWVKPDEAMKKLVWSETDVEGPLKFDGKLPQPPSENGPIRDLSIGGDINTGVLLHRISVEKDGRLLLPDGMIYRMLVLPPTTLMTPEVLRRIHDLVTEGATVVGECPVRSPSLVGYPQSDREVHDLAADLWGGTDGVTNTQQAYGKGMVIWGLPLKGSE